MINNQNRCLKGGKTVMYQNLKKKSEGFTIIEVLIVLAIAALIMLIVFLAVPALQRNSRNNGRNNDAARISAAVIECLSNRNGDANGCNDDAEISTGNRNQLVGAVTFGVNPVAANYSQTAAHVTFAATCDPQGSTAQSVLNARQIAVTFQLEPNINRCIQG